LTDKKLFEKIFEQKPEGKMKKKLFVLFLAVVFVFAFAACNSISDEDLLGFSDRNEKFGESLSAFEEHCYALIDEQEDSEITSSVFAADLAAAQTAFVSEALHYAAIALYNSAGNAYNEETGLSGVSKVGDTYTLTYDADGGTTDTVVFKLSETSSQYEFFECCMTRLRFQRIRTASCFRLV